MGTIRSRYPMSIITVIGPDGAGKSTLTKRISSEIGGMKIYGGRACDEYVSWPLRWIYGIRGRLTSVIPSAMVALYTWVLMYPAEVMFWGRRLRRYSELSNSGNICILLDRSFIDRMVLAVFKQRTARSWFQRIAYRLFCALGVLRYRKLSNQIDLVIYVDTPPEVIAKRRPGAYSSMEEIHQWCKSYEITLDSLSLDTLVISIPGDQDGPLNTKLQEAFKAIQRVQ